MSDYRKNVYATGFLLLALAAVILVAAFAWRGLSGPGDQTKVTAQSILERISDQYFIVTKTAYIDQEAEITVDKGSKWSNLLWGQTVKAQGVIRVDVGVDLSKLTEADIEVNRAERTVRIRVPEAEIMNASQNGDIEVTSDQGVLKFLLDNDPNEDHNRALAELIAGAKAAVLQDTALFDEARLDSAKILDLIVSGMGYKLIIVAATQNV
jgi:hypothetical protein